jgi:hypothetical protein
MYHQKQSQLMLPMIVLVIAVVVLSFFLVRALSGQFFAAPADRTTAFEAGSVPASAPFDYTRDRDQYWQQTAAIESAAPFD